MYLLKKFFAIIHEYFEVNNDMAGAEEDSWKTMFETAGFNVECQIHGLGSIADVQALYVAHTKAAIDALNA